MIIKSVRVKTSASLRKLCTHMFRGDENDEVVVLQGTEADVADFFADAKKRGHDFATRAWIISPHDCTTREEALSIAKALVEEFGGAFSFAVILEHQKARATDAFDRHWHVLMCETDPASGRVLASAHDHARHEYIARRAEFRLGHAFVLGPHHKAVLARLRRESLTATARALDTAFPEAAATMRPREAFTHADHQAAKRRGIDLPAIRATVRTAWAGRTDLATLEAALAANGLSLKFGDKEWIIQTADDPVFVKSFCRLSGARKADFARFMEDAHARSSNAGNGPEPDDRNLGNTRRGADTRKVRQTDCSPAGGRIGSPEMAGRSVDDRGQPGEDPSFVGTAAQIGFGAWDRERSKETRRGILAVVDAVAAKSRPLRARAAKLVAPDVRTARRLNRLEHEAAAIQAATLNLKHPSEDALQQAKETADRRLESYRSVKSRIDKITVERQQAVDALRQAPAWRRWKGAAEHQKRIERLESDRKALMEQLKPVEAFLLSATGNVRQAEQRLAAEVAARKSEIAACSKTKTRILGHVTLVRKLLLMQPSMAFCGPDFATQLATQIESARSKLRDPWARDIWGLPLRGPSD